MIDLTQDCFTAKQYSHKLKNDNKKKSHNYLRPHCRLSLITTSRPSHVPNLYANYKIPFLIFKDTILEFFRDTIPNGLWLSIKLCSFFT